MEEIQEEDDEVLKQLKKTQAHMSVWHLLVSSQRHRQSMLEKLATIEVPIETTPEGLLAFISDISPYSIITFIDDDLPSEGTAHNKPLCITVECQGQQVPYCLVHTGTAC